MTYASPQALADDVERQIASEFYQRGRRLLPITQADADAARAKADEMFRSASQQALERSSRLTKTALRNRHYINDVQLSRALIDALNRRRA